MTYAEKLVADLWRANTETHEKRVSIISAALKRQRMECMIAYAQWTALHNQYDWKGAKDAILGAEVEE